MSMRAWQVSAWGEPEAMALASVDLPKPGPDQVRIRNRAAGLNFFDILQIQGKYQYKPAFPFTPGAEVAGGVGDGGSGGVQVAPRDHGRGEAGGPRRAGLKARDKATNV